MCLWEWCMFDIKWMVFIYYECIKEDNYFIPDIKYKWTHGLA